MKVFVAGATGVLGRSAVSALVRAGHSVTGVARTPAKEALLRRLDVTPVSTDLFDSRALMSAVDGSEVVCNFATRIPVSFVGYLRGRGWRANNRLHREVSRKLADAAMSTGIGRFLQHSIAFQYADSADRWIDEDGDLQPPPHGLAVLEAERQARRFTRRAASESCFASACSTDLKRRVRVA